MRHATLHFFLALPFFPLFFPKLFFSIVAWLFIFDVNGDELLFFLSVCVRGQV